MAFPLSYLSSEALRSAISHLRAGELRVPVLGALSSARVVSILLATALGAQAAITATNVASLLIKRTVGGKRVDQPRAVRSPAASLAALGDANLFGAPASADPPETDPTPVSNTPLVLTGTISTGDPTQGFAIVGKDRLSAHTRLVGEAVADGVTLREVYTDHAVIDRGGQLETIWLPHSSVSLTSTRLLAARSEAATPQPVLPALSPEVRERLEYENARVGVAFTESALADHEQFRALVVQAGADPSMLTQMGLKPGDVVQGVDNINIDANNVDLLRKSLASGRKVRLNIIRPQEGPMNLELDSAQYQGLVSN
jgi:type II secretory pathway component PulC